MIAVLAYPHSGVAPSTMVEDVAALRASGWLDVNLQRLQTLLGQRGDRRYFHVTLAVAGSGASECAKELSSISCACTLFLSLDRIDEAVQADYRELRHRHHVSLQDQTLRHARSFQFRKVICFHSAEAPCLPDADGLDLVEGAPVCLHGSELSRPRFVVDPVAVEKCRETARTFQGLRGGLSWLEAQKYPLRRSGLGWDQFGRFCISGTYESRCKHRRRVAEYLASGFERLTDFEGERPVAFAFPWGEGSGFVDRCLKRLGYGMSFSGTGLCLERRLFGIPRIFVDEHSPRPLDVIALATGKAPRFDRLKHSFRRLRYV